MKEIAKYSDWLLYLSLIGLVVAAYGAFSGNDLVWLAPTQWMLVSGVVVTYAIYLKLSK